MPSFTTLDVPGSYSTEILSTHLGTVTGYYTDAYGIARGFYFDGYGFGAVSVGQATILTYDGTYILAGGVGYTASACLNPGSGGSSGWVDNGYSFVYVDVGYSTMVFGGNDNNILVGSYTDSQNHVHGFNYYLGSFGTIDPPGAIESYATGINNNDAMVGLWVTPDGHQHGYLATFGGAFQQIDVPGATSTIARGIDDFGDIVGAYQDAAGVRHGFELTGSTFQTIDVPGALATTCYGVDGSTVVGSYVDASGRTHGFVTDGFVPTSSGSFAVSAFPSPITAGTSGSFTVTAKNADGTTATGYTGTVYFTSSDPQAVLPANYTFAAADAGVHTFSASLKTAGTQSITVRDTTTGITGTDSGITVNPAVASTLSVGGFPSPITAGLAGTFTVTARDSYGNIATGYTGTVKFTSSDAKATLPANYTFTASDAGVHTFSATLKTAGTQSITATDSTTASMTGTDAGITVNPAAASQFIISAPSSVTVGVQFSLTVKVEDAYGNVVTNYTGTIHFSSTDGMAKLPKDYTFTVADKGVHTFTGLVLRKRGYQKITITDTLNTSLTASVIVDVL